MAAAGRRHVSEDLTAEPSHELGDRRGLGAYPGGTMFTIVPDNTTMNVLVNADRV